MSRGAVSPLHSDAKHRKHGKSDHHFGGCTDAHIALEHSLEWRGLDLSAPCSPQLVHSHFTTASQIAVYL